ncbi:hypothetical protein C8R47DRAFT_1219711 [Mycena vitilis]|nr:hypothetical protein C8R47DRAFT_1219711 [Mycena vitilis]
MSSTSKLPLVHKLSNVPFDVWGCVFTAVLESSTQSPPQYAYLRRRLCNVCQTWRTTVYSTPTFWSILFLHKNTTLRSLQNWIDLSGALALTISLHLHNDAEISPPKILWSVLNPVLDRIAVLAISAFDEQSLVAAFSSLRNNELTTLTALTVYAGICARRCTLERAVLAQLVVPSSDVTFLRLHGVHVDWPGSVSWHSLTSLILIDQANIMTWKDFQDVSKEAVHLRRLGMRDVGCRELPSTLETLVFPSVENFFLVFGGGAAGTILLEQVLREEVKDPGWISQSLPL